VWLESPTNPQLEVLDIAALAQLTHAFDGRLAVDNTFASPVGQQPIELGADIVMHATTKFISGHSDVIGGAIISKEDDAYFARIREVQQLAGGVPSPFDCYQVMRGMRSLVPRYLQQAATAAAVADFLETHPAVEAVYYPGLASHPQFATAQQQMYSAGAMLSFTVKAGKSAALAAIAKCQLWLCATSLGGTESLMEHRESSEGEGSTTPDNLIRLSVGLEDADALVADLAQALG
jgi:cystathionine gamma-synthase